MSKVVGHGAHYLHPPNAEVVSASSETSMPSMPPCSYGLINFSFKVQKIFLYILFVYFCCTVLLIDVLFIK
jgi:hypothetical protein